MSESMDVLSRILIVSSKITVDSDTTQLVIPFDGAGSYFIVPCPIITANEAIASGHVYVFSSGSFLYAATSDKLLNNSTSSFNSSGVLGYWTCTTSFEDSTNTNIVYKPGPTGSVTILAGHDYYVLKPRY